MLLALQKVFVRWLSGTSGGIQILHENKPLVANDTDKREKKKKKLITSFPNPLSTNS